MYGTAWVYGDARVYGDAWVYGNAWVYGDAWVYGNAQVYGNAWVYGDAWVYGNAQVYGNARVYGDAWKTSPLYIQGTKYAAYMCDSRRFAVGCQRYTFAGWHKFWREIAKRNGFTKEEQKEYIMYFNLACERYGKVEYKVSFEDESGKGEVDE